MRRAVYAGSFDPITNGHMWMIERGAELFDELIVAVAVNPEKDPWFSMDGRREMVEKATRHMPNVSVDAFELGYLATYTASMSAGWLLRGIRDTDDFRKERRMNHANQEIEPDIATVMLNPPLLLEEISSSYVKGWIVRGAEWEPKVERYVPRHVFNRLLIHKGGLYDRWCVLWQRAGAEGSPDHVYNAILERYGQPHRMYHNFVHVVHSLREMDEVRDMLLDPIAVELALWGHDAEYGPGGGHDEERSAHFICQHLRAAALEPLADNVGALVTVTKHSNETGAGDALYMADIDLAILGQPWETFAAYEQDIREEFGWLPDGQWRQGRGEFLDGMLARDAVYRTEHFHEKYEAQARENIERSILALT